MKISNKKHLLQFVSLIVLMGIILSGCSSKSNSPNRRDSDSDDDEEYDSYVDDDDSYVDDDDSYEEDYTSPTTVKTPEINVSAQEVSTTFTKYFRGYTLASCLNSINGLGNYFKINCTGPRHANIQGYENYYAVKSVECTSVNPPTLNIVCTYDLYGVNLETAVEVLEKVYGVPSNRIQTFNKATVDAQGNIRQNGGPVLVLSNFVVEEIYDIEGGDVGLGVKRDTAATVGNLLNFLGNNGKDIISAWRAYSDDKAARENAAYEARRAEMENWMDYWFTF